MVEKLTNILNEDIPVLTRFWEIHLLLDISISSIELISASPVRYNLRRPSVVFKQNNRTYLDLSYQQQYVED